MILAASIESRSAGRLFLIAITLLLAACSVEPEPLKLTGASMGTRWHATIVPPPEGADAGRLQAGIQAQLDRVEQSMSTYRPSSEISLVNAAPVNTPVPVSGDFYAVLSTALAVGRQSSGAYDVTVGSLVDLWGFGASGPLDSVPEPRAVEMLATQGGHRHLRLDGESPSVLKQSALQLDFSSLAKGYGVDVVANWLQEQGIRRYLVEVGGEMRVAGLSHRGNNWQVAIEKPDSTGRSAAAGVSLTDSAIATSGDYRNYFELEGKRYSHLIDPRTGWPVAHDLVSVTVIHPSAMLADAWATALTVLGFDDAMVVAQEQGLAVYFIQRDGDSLRYRHTAEFSPYLVVQQQQGEGARE